MKPRGNWSGKKASTRKRREKWRLPGCEMPLLEELLLRRLKNVSRGQKPAPFFLTYYYYNFWLSLIVSCVGGWRDSLLSQKYNKWLSAADPIFNDEDRTSKCGLLIHKQQRKSTLFCPLPFPYFHSSCKKKVLTCFFLIITTSSYHTYSI